MTETGALHPSRNKKLDKYAHHGAQKDAIEVRRRCRGNPLACVSRSRTS